MQKRSWKLIAHVPGLDEKPAWKEYFLVRDAGQMQAVAALLRARTDLADCRIEQKGEAGRDLVDWLEPDSDVFRCLRADPLGPSAAALFCLEIAVWTDDRSMVKRALTSPYLW